MATNAEGTQNEAGRHQEVGHKSLLQSDALNQYISETSVYSREPEPMKKLTEITTKHRWNKGVLNFSFKFGDTVAPAPGSTVAASPTPGGYPYPLAPAPGSTVAASPTPGGYPYPLAPGYGGYPYPLAPGYGGYPYPLAPAPGSTVAAPPTPGGYPYPLAPGYGGYPYPLAPGYGGYPYPVAPGYGGYTFPQMQPQEKTSMRKKLAKKLGVFLCGFIGIAAADMLFLIIYKVGV